MLCFHQPVTGESSREKKKRMRGFRTVFDFFLDLTKNVGLSKVLFSGRLRHSREQKISNFGLRRPEKSRNLEKAEKLSKMSCFVMAFSGVLEKNQV